MGIDDAGLRRQERRDAPEERLARRELRRTLDAYHDPAQRMEAKQDRDLEISRETRDAVEEIRDELRGEE